MSRISCNGAVRRGYLGALFVSSDWWVRVFWLSGIVDIPSDRLDACTIPLYGCMDRRSNYTLLPRYSSSPILIITEILLIPFKDLNNWIPPLPTHFSLLKGFSSLNHTSPSLAETIQFHFRLLVTMRHEDLFTDIMYVIHGMYTPFTSATSYHVTNRKTRPLMD